MVVYIGIILRGLLDLRFKLNGVSWRYFGIDINVVNLMIFYLVLIYLDLFLFLCFGDGIFCLDKDEKEILWLW